MQVSPVKILVDGDNVFKTEYAGQGITNLGSELNRFLQLSFTVQPDTTQIDIRIYGGWKAGNLLTNRASVFLREIGASKTFPLVRSGSLVRGSINLATSLLIDPTIEWDNTFRVKKGLKRIRLSEAPCFDGCLQAASECSVRRFVKFTKGKGSTCPTIGCNVKNEDVFKSVEQKMVDTMLACDLSSIAINSKVATVVIITEDTDLLPAIVQARYISMQSQLNQKHILVLPRHNHAPLHQFDLQARGISTLEWESF